MTHAKHAGNLALVTQGLRLVHMGLETSCSFSWSGSADRAGLFLSSKGCLELGWRGGRKWLLINGPAAAIPSTLSICPITPMGSSWRTPLSSSWIPLKVLGMVQNGSSTKESGSQPILLTLPEICSQDPKEGRGPGSRFNGCFPEEREPRKLRRSASENHYCHNCPLNVQGWVCQWPPRILTFLSRPAVKERHRH